MHEPETRPRVSYVPFERLSRWRVKGVRDALFPDDREHA